METEFTKVRKQVREDMSPEYRHLLAKAIAHEESDRLTNTEAHYAWNRVWRAIDEAQRLESPAAKPERKKAK